MLRFVVALFVIFFSYHSYGKDEFSGFATLTASYSQEPKIAKKINIISGDFGYDSTSRWDIKSNSLLGLQWQHTFNEQWQSVAQVVLKDRAKQNLDTLTQLAFLRYQPNPNWSIRAGRMGLNLFVMTQYRNAGYAYTSVQPPAELYGFIPHQKLDGIDVTYTTPLASGLLRTNVFAGRSEDTITDTNFEWDSLLSDILGVTFEYELGNWLFILNNSRTKMSTEPQSLIDLKQAFGFVPLEVWPTKNHIIDDLSIVDKTFKYQNFSFKYDNGTMYSQSEVVHIHSDSAALEHFVHKYIQFGTRFDLHTLQVGLSNSQAARHHIEPALISTPELDALYGYSYGFLNEYAIDKTSYSLTWRYELTSSLALKLQWDRINLKKPIASINSHTRWFNHFSTSVNWVF